MIIRLAWAAVIILSPSGSIEQANMSDIVNILISNAIIDPTAAVAAIPQKHHNLLPIHPNKLPRPPNSVTPQPAVVHVANPDTRSPSPNRRHPPTRNATPLL